MPSLYAQYLTERTEDRILEDDRGFVTWRLIDRGGVQCCYIVDIYVIPEARRDHVATRLANEVAGEAVRRGCKLLLGTVNPSTRGATESIQTLIAYGMRVLEAQPNVIIFGKDI